MKKHLIGLILGLLCGMGYAQQMVVAIAPFTVHSKSVSTADAVAIVNVFSLRLAATKIVRVVTHSALEDTVRKEKFQLEDWEDDKKTALLARTLNANWIVRGAIEKVGNNIVVSAAVLDVTTFEIIAGKPIQFDDISDAFNKVEPLVLEISQVLGGRVASKKRTATGPQMEYTIGDFGPAGGIIFYDKGRFSNGWRYLEAAPFETEVDAQWGAYERDIKGTSDRLGTGRDNTNLIIKSLRMFSETGKAAQVCNDLVYEGFDDWFLPSKEELNLMYKNLKSVGLGDFRDKWYWSSSRSEGDFSWRQHFGDGQQNVGYGKYFTSCVRAIRAF
jgi:TolB-like protein